MNSDKQITDIVVQALLWDARVSPARISVYTTNGVVTLSGTVENFYKKWSALDTVMKLPDVVEVRDQIKIKLNDITEDIDIRQNINKALKNDSRLEHTDVFCNVKRGNVILTGKVNTQYQRIAAEETCRWIKGVIKVDNKIKISSRNKNYDNKIKQKLEELLRIDSNINEQDIKVKVDNGTVLLMGQVDRIYKKIQAEVLASLVSNVAFVINEIVIKK